jgi:extracellular elastinolytic metalloproteinase
MRLKFLAPLVGVLAAFLVVAGSASADAGTFSGTITPTACGPLQPVQVAAGETTIDAVAAATVPANDITLDLYDPGGALKAHGDTATSPEEVLYQSADLQPGTWNVQVCPFPGGVVSAPYSYTGTYTTSSAPVAPGTPGSTGGGSGGTPTPTYVAGKLVFSPATVVDPQRTEG